jgi:hypothetical protein
MLWITIAIIGWLVALCLFILLALVSVAHSFVYAENKELKKLQTEKVAKPSYSSRVWKTKEV